MNHRFLRTALCLAAALSAGAPLVASSLQAPSGAVGWFAVTVDGATCVRRGAGEAEVCWDMPVGHTLGDLREVTGGWVAAGHGAIDGIVDLFLLRGDLSGVAPLPLPAAGSAARGAPRVVSDDNRLLGLIWLEGDAQEKLEVKAAEWLDGAWSPVATVSPVATGSQVAPAVTVLDDGRWLLLWTQFDGEDDETVWSVFDRDRWSAPRRLHEDNASPDITPAVLATRTGAVAAWSWLDGRDYRVRTASFDGRRWREGAVLEGRGGLDARLFELAGGSVLTFSTVVPEEWVAYELGPAGEPGRRSAVPLEHAGPPRVEVGGAGVIFDWDEDFGESKP